MKVKNLLMLFILALATASCSNPAKSYVDRAKDLKGQLEAAVSAGDQEKINDLVKQKTELEDEAQQAIKDGEFTTDELMKESAKAGLFN